MGFRGIIAMKLAIPIRDGRISPVFDAAGRFLVVEFDGKEPARRSEYTVMEPGGEARAALLRELGVSLLICGAISNRASRIVERCGIELMPWLVGEIDDVIEAYCMGSLGGEGFIMPGCRRGHGAGRGNRQGRRFIWRGEDRGAAGDDSRRKPGNSTGRGGGRRNRE
jgi:predicted Fe-Mo cluster-binding NifX family protein